MHRRSLLIGLVATCVIAPDYAPAQDRGAAALGELVRGLGVNTRVLVIGAHPDDEDTQLITWLARGRQIETAYLSLTRGDGGQNLIGNELGEALGAIRTEELLAARRIDGGHQYFTRAYDFGFSKSADETYKHWPKDSLLRDVVTVVRDFRPHVIVAVFSGTPRDGHGHHQVSGLLAREAYDIAGDSVRMPRSATQGRAPWTPLKFYRSARSGGGGEATYRFDVGEYSPLQGRSYAEIAAESRSQHKSQAFGSLQRKGAVMDAVRLEASRVGPIPVAGAIERSIFDGIDTTWARIERGGGIRREDVQAIPGLITAVERTFNPYAPEKLLAPLDQLWRAAVRLQQMATGDAERSFAELADRATRAKLLASGLGVEATVDHETWAEDEPIRATVSIYNRALPAVSLGASFPAAGDSNVRLREIPRAGSVSFVDTVRRVALTQPWWLARPRSGDLFAVPIAAKPEDELHGLAAEISGSLAAEAGWIVTQPVVYRFADPVKGEIQRPIAVVPAVSVTVDQPVQYVPANRPFDRAIRVELRSASNHPRSVSVSLQLPRGLVADSVTRTIGLPDYAGSFGAEGEPQGIPGGRPVPGNSPTRTVEFRVHGMLGEGRYTISAVAESEGKRFATGYTLIEYDHIRPQRLFRDATISLSAVRLQVAPRLNVAYIPGVGDNVAPMLQQLGVPLTVIEPDKLAGADLSRYTTVVVGTRAYESSPALVAANPRLLDFARAGGTLVAQYGQFEMANPGIMPYPVTIARPADRVTEEDAAVRVTDPASPLLNVPNRIGPRDWDGWVQERSLYMPRTHDERYRAMLSMNDTGEPPNDGAILVAPLGKGTYVYTTLALFRQLPAGVPGGARLFVNLLSADQRSSGTPQSAPKP